MHSRSNSLIKIHMIKQYLFFSISSPPIHLIEILKKEKEKEEKI